jgi:hypothetical protein
MRTVGLPKLKNSGQQAIISVHHKNKLRITI